LPGVLPENSASSGTIQPEQHYSPIAQLVERLTVNQFVPGSSPGRGAKFK
jgi:hypothetical protein